MARTRITKIEHIAVVVEDINAALAFWRDGLGIEVTQVRDVPAEGARIAFLPLGESEIELVQPISADTGLSRYLATRGSGMHHVCLGVDDIQEMLDLLKGKGVQLINEAPRIDESGRMYAFIHPKSTGGVLVELYEVPKNA